MRRRQKRTIICITTPMMSHHLQQPFPILSAKAPQQLVSDHLTGSASCLALRFERVSSCMEYQRVRNQSILIASHQDREKETLLPC